MFRLNRLPEFYQQFWTWGRTPKNDRKHCKIGLVESCHVSLGICLNYVSGCLFISRPRGNRFWFYSPWASARHSMVHCSRKVVEEEADIDSDSGDHQARNIVETEESSTKYDASFPFSSYHPRPNQQHRARNHCGISGNYCIGCFVLGS